MQELLENGRLVWRLLQDGRVPRWIKIGIPLAVALYVLMPIDLIPDFIPVLGQMDDLGLVLFGMNLIVRFAPREVVEEHRNALGFSPTGKGQVPPQQPAGTYWQTPPRAKDGRAQDGSIEGEYRVVGEENYRQQ